MQVMDERDGVAGIHQLAKHFLIGENLTGIGTGKLEIFDWFDHYSWFTAASRACQLLAIVESAIFQT